MSGWRVGVVWWGEGGESVQTDYALLTGWVHSPGTSLDNTACMQLSRGIRFIRINPFKKKCNDRIQKCNDNFNKQNPLLNMMPFIFLATLLFS